MKTNKKGITLIALVITIIILLILAAVAIQLALGENGLIGRAQSGQEKQSMAEATDKFKTAQASAWADFILEGKSSDAVEKYVTALNAALSSITDPNIKGVTVGGTFGMNGTPGSYTLQSSTISLLFNGQVKGSISMDTEGKVTVSLN